MKIEQKNENFQQIVITLETLEEAQALKTVCGRILGDGIIRNITDILYNKLNNIGIKSNNNLVVQNMKVK